MEVSFDDEMDRSQAVVGYILAKLYGAGLETMTLRPSDFSDSIGDIENGLMVDVVAWMMHEGLIRTRMDYLNSSECLHHAWTQKRVDGLQLTAKGIAVLKEPDAQEIVKASLDESGEKGLSAPSYSKLGSLIGGMIGGLLKSVG